MKCKEGKLKYQEGDVIGSVTLVITEVDNAEGVEYPYSMAPREDVNMWALLEEVHSEGEILELQAKLNPLKRKELLLAKRAEIDKELERL